MAISKSGWIDVVGTDGGKTNVVAAGTASGNIDCAGANKYITVAIKTVVIFGATPDDNVLVELFGRDSDDADELDTVPMYGFEIVAVAGTEERVTRQVEVSSLDGLTVTLTNNDSADAVDVWVEIQGAY